MQTISNNSPVPDNLLANQYISNLDQSSVFGETNRSIAGIDFKEIYVKLEEFQPLITKPIDPYYLSIMQMSPNQLGESEQSEALSFEIESYMKANTANSAKGVSRVVLVNEKGERVLDVQIKMTDNVPSKNRQQA